MISTPTPASAKPPCNGPEVKRATAASTMIHPDTNKKMAMSLIIRILFQRWPGPIDNLDFAYKRFPLSAGCRAAGY